MPEGTGEGNTTGAGTGEKPAWISQLPSDLKDNQAFTSYKTIGDLAKAHLEVSGKVKEFDGMKAKLDNSIPKLAADAKPEDREAFFKAIGRPDKPEAYEIKGEGIDLATITEAKAEFHKFGLTNDQAQAMVNLQLGLVKKANDAFVAQSIKDEETETAKLKTELGDKFEATKTLGERLFTKHFAGDKDFIQFLKTPTREGMIPGNNPFLIRFFAKIAQLTGEDKSSPGSPSRAPETVKGILYDKSPDPGKSGY